jgi:predicted methyltransferase
MKTALLSCLLLIALPAFGAAPTPIEKSIASPERTDADRERDKRDKPPRSWHSPVCVRAWWSLTSSRAGGYYTELLAGVVGPDGQGARREQHVPMRPMRRMTSRRASPKVGSRTSSAAWSKPAT